MKPNFKTLHDQNFISAVSTRQKISRTGSVKVKAEILIQNIITLIKFNADHKMNKVQDCHKKHPSTGSVLDIGIFGQFKGPNPKVPGALWQVIELSLDIKIQATNIR